MGWLKELRRRVEAIGIPCAVQLECAREFHGNRKGGWTLCPDSLNSESVVYSVGVGNNLSFDVSLVRRFGFRVHAFDPTPEVIAWFHAREWPAEIRLHEYGLADFDGMADFSPDPNPKEVSHTLMGRPGSQAPISRVPVHRLSTVMTRLGHSRIDLLKIDIEGAEYGVIEQIVGEGLPVRQLLVEFHHRFPNIGKPRTVEAIRRLNSAGYRIFHVSEARREFSFLQG